GPGPVRPGGGPLGLGAPLVCDGRPDGQRPREGPTGRRREETPRAARARRGEGRRAARRPPGGTPPAMCTRLVPGEELALDQVRAVERRRQEHSALCGGQGPGKTQVLVHRARHLLDRAEPGSDSLLILVYTNVLKDYIASALDLLRLPRQCVTTFD